LRIGEVKKVVKKMAIVKLGNILYN